MVLPVICHGTGYSGSGQHKRMVDPRQERLLLPLGAVDRDKGVFRTQRGDTRDVRNVLLRDGTLHLRPGFSATMTFPEDSVDVLAMKYLPYEDLLLIVGIEASGQVKVYKVASLGDDPVFVDDWFTWDVATYGNPAISIAQSYQSVFMAHAEDDISLRQPTYVYDHGTGLLGPLVPTGWNNAEPIKFRGVVAYLDYIVGWGYGNNIEDRPELVRISRPSEPMRFDEEAWLVAGTRGDPIITCAPAGNGLLILKATETYPLLGTSPQTFGVGPAVDYKFGCVGTNLWTNLNGTLYVWSAEGPRVTTGGPLQDLAIPLDLDGPPPADTLSREHIRTGFATYVPEKRVILFIFHPLEVNGVLAGWAYALDVRNGTPGGWSYWVFGYGVGASEVWYMPTEGGGGSYGGEVVAGPYFKEVDTISDLTMDLIVENPTDPANNPNAYIQTFYRKTESEDNFHYAADAQILAGPAGSTPTVRLKNLQPDTEYRIAFRYDVLGRHNANYPGSTSNPELEPDGWPAASVTTQRTLELQDLGAEWERTGLPPGNEQVNLSWSVPLLEPDDTLRYLEKSVGLGTPAWQIEENAIPQEPPEWAYIVKTAENENEAYIQFRVRPISASDGPQALLWTGPPATALMSRDGWLYGDLHATFEDLPGTGQPILEIAFTFTTGNEGELLRVDKLASAYTYVADPSTDGPMGAEFQWEEYTGETLTNSWTDGPYGPSHLEIRGLTGLVISETTGAYIPPDVHEGPIYAGRNYRVRCRTLMVYPNTWNIYDYIADPTGKCLDYSDWSDWTPLISST